MKKKAQKNSVFARIWRSKYQTLYGMVSFILLYSMLLYTGGRLFFVAGILYEGGSGKRWPSFLIVGLIILASSLLSRMFQDCLRERKREVSRLDQENNKIEEADLVGIEKKR